MFLAVRDLTFAKGRFALIGGVIAMITLLVVMLTGLSAGLARESVASITTLGSRGVDQIGFAKPPLGQKVGFATSTTTDVDLTAAKRQPGVEKSATLTLAPQRVRVGAADAAVQVFSASQSWAAPSGVTEGKAVVGQALAKDAGATVGQRIRVGDATVTIAKISADASYQHTPVVWLSAADARTSGVLNGRGTQRVLALQTSNTFDASAAQHNTGVTFMNPSDALGTIESYKAENGSLTLMRVMLLVVSALVVGAFFTVWTIQRTPDLAVLKAMGAKTSTLVLDAVGQAGVLLLIGGGLGAALAAAAGSFAQQQVPFVLNASTTVIPLLSLIALGLLGALVSVRRIATIDPNTALGALR